MSLSPVRNLQLHNQIERVLHVSGNYQGGILEMALVVDRAYDRETVRALCADIIESCKKQSEIFRNIRLNMVMWSGEEIHTEVAAAAYVQMGAFFDTYVQEDAVSDKNAVELMQYLKKFHARSKLIIVLVRDQEKFCRVTEPVKLRQAMSPFLKQKLVIVYPEEISAGINLFMCCG